MQQASIVNFEGQPRQIKLEAWLLLNPRTKRDMARRAGCSEQFLGKALRAETAPAWLVDHLRRVEGIPAELLPEPVFSPRETRFQLP